MKNAFLSITHGLRRTFQTGVLSGRERRLKLCETLSLGERRFVALVQVDHREFLIGGSGSSIELLANLSSSAASADASPSPDHFSCGAETVPGPPEWEVESWA